ncbi:MAG: hypothetical protein MI741_11815, partial [Rhodospirillales bacterium]|nr:hypothetical protein [Rhodospirillales bacterium]
AAFLDTFSFGYVVTLPMGVTFDATYTYDIRHNDHTSSRYANLRWENGQVVSLKNPAAPENFYYNDEWSSVHYQGLALTATREFRQGWQLIASYTYQDQTLKGEWSPHSREIHLYPQSWFEVSHYGNLAPHLFNLAASFLLPYDVILNANINARAGYYEDPRQHPFDPGQPYRTTLPDGTEIYNPFSGTMYAQPRNAERSQMDGVMNVNLGLGKQFSFGPYRIQTQFQVFNIFNADSFTQFGWPRVYYDENLQPLGDFNYNNIQSPRAAQLLVKFTF